MRSLYCINIIILLSIVYIISYQELCDLLCLICELNCITDMFVHKTII